MKHFILIIILFCATFTTKAQDFKQAAGIRMGWTPGFEYRIFTDPANSYKFLLGTRDRGVQLHLFKEFHRYNMFSFTDQITFFYGAGLHAGYEKWDVIHYHENTQWYETRTGLIAGLDGLVGLEYTFYEVPISLGIEAKPYFEFFGQEIFDVEIFDFAFTAKYLF
jgi:hypothetical protein